MTSSEPVIITCSYGGRQGAKGDAGSDGTAADTGYWLTGTTYAAGDRCYHDKDGYGQSVYRCKTGQGHIAGATTEPEVGASWEEKWELFAEGGQNGSVIGEGAAGGQTIIGGTGANEGLTFYTTSHNTKGAFKFLSGYPFFGWNADGFPFPAGAAGEGGLAITWNYVGGSRAVDLWNTDPANLSDTSYWFRQLQGETFVTVLRILANGNLIAPGTLAGAGLSLTGPVKQSILSKTANYTIADDDPDIVVIGAITALAHTTIILPTAADNVGRIITVVIDGDPGAKNVIVDGEGAETINGAATKTNSDRYSYLRLLCNGTGWNIIGSAGTWS